MPYINQIKKLVHQEYSGKLINVCVSGSHLYGFESKDSDVDLRGCWLIDTNNLLGIHAPRDYVERTDGEYDIVLFELKKEIGLLNKGNCNVLEHMFANQLFTSDEYFELKKIISLNLNIPGLYNSYRGMAWENYNKFCLKGMHTVKKFLYVFRAILAGMYVIEHRIIQPNLGKLIEGKESTYYYEPIMELIRLKKQGLEKDFLPDSSLPKYHKLVENLLSTLDMMYEQNKPSEKVQAELNHARERDLDAFLKKIRKNYMRKNNGEDFMVTDQPVKFEIIEKPTGCHLFESLDAYKLHKKDYPNFIDDFWEKELKHKNRWKFWR